jgi:hypothetical protein
MAEDMFNAGADTALMLIDLDLFGCKGLVARRFVLRIFERSFSFFGWVSIATER